jgi:hypothetical protein
MTSSSAFVTHGCRANVLLSGVFRAKRIPGMAWNFLVCDREQPFLSPPDVREWLPEDHLAWSVIDAVGVMDTSRFSSRHDRRQRQRHAAHFCLDGAVQPRDAPGGLPEAMLSAALCGPMKGHLAAPGHRVSGDTTSRCRRLRCRLATATHSSRATASARSPTARGSSRSRARPRRAPHATNQRRRQLTLREGRKGRVRGDSGRTRRWAPT